MQIVVDVHLDPEHALLAWEVRPRLRDMPFVGACVRRVRDDGAAERVDPVVAQAAKIAAIAPRSLIPNLQGYVGEVRVRSPLDGEDAAGFEDVVSGRVENFLLDWRGQGGFLRETQREE